MLKLLQLLFIGHCHKWENKEESIAKEHGRTIGKIIVMRCETCGKLKNHKIEW